MNGYIASSVSQLQTGGLYFSLNWVLFCYPSLESIRFVTTSKILNLYCVGETNEELANKYLNRINSYIGHNFNHLMSIYIIPKKDSFLDGDEEGDGLFAVDEPVVVGEGEIHHRPDLHLAIDGDRTRLDRVHAEDGGLGRVEDRRGKDGAVDAAVGDGEDAAFEIGQGKFSFAGALGDLGEGLFDPGQVELVAVAEDGNHQAFLGADGDADVVIVLLDDLLALDPGVDGGDGPQGVDGGLDEEGHEAEFHPVLGLEDGLDLGAEGDELGEIGLVEGGEDGGGVLGADEAVGDFAAERGETAAGFAAGAESSG